MQKYRQNQSEAEKEERNEKARLGMLKFRQFRETSEEKDLRLEKERERKKRDMEERSEDEIEDFKNMNKEEKRKSRKERNEEIRDYQKIENKHKRRLTRKNISKEQKFEMNQVATEGMRKLRLDGRLKPFIEGGKQNNSEVNDFKKYYEASADNSELLNGIRPDIMAQINEINRKEKEELRDRQEKRKLKDFEEREFHENIELRPTEKEKEEVAQIKKKILEKKEKEKKMKDLKYASLSVEEKEDLRKKNICLGLKEHVAWIKKLKQQNENETIEIEENEDKQDDEKVNNLKKKKILKVTYS